MTSHTETLLREWEKQVVNVAPSPLTLAGDALAAALEAAEKEIEPLVAENGQLALQLKASLLREATLRDLLARVEPALAPNHDAANELSAKFGLGPIGAVNLIAEIRATLAGSPGDT